MNVSTTDRSLAGKIPKLETVWEEHSRTVYTLCLRLVGDPDAAEDVTVEVFSHFSRELPRLTNERRIPVRLRELAIEKSVGWLEKHHRLREGEPDEPSPVTRLSGRAPLPGPVEMDEFVIGLPAHLRVALVLRDVEDLSDSEVAVALQTDVEDVRRRLNRARLELRERIVSSSGSKGDS